MKKILLLSLAVMAFFSAAAQTPEWRKQLDRLDEEADQFYEKKEWKKLVANQEKYRKVFMSLPDSVQQEHFWDTRNSCRIPEMRVLQFCLQENGR